MRLHRIGWLTSAITEQFVMDHISLLLKLVEAGLKQVNEPSTKHTTFVQISVCHF